MTRYDIIHSGIFCWTFGPGKFTLKNVLFLHLNNK